MGLQIIAVMTAIQIGYIGYGQDTDTRATGVLTLFVLMAIAGVIGHYPNMERLGGLLLSTAFVLGVSFAFGHLIAWWQRQRQ